MEGLDFFTIDSDVWYKTEDSMERLTEGSPVVDEMSRVIEELYPDASKALKECYHKNRMNVSYFMYKCVKRFCKCNFGSGQNKDESGGHFRFERVACPLRGDCPYEGRICSPRLATALSEAEKRVMRLVCEGMTNFEIADELYLSPNTIKRHISTSYIKVGVRNRTEFMKYANQHNLLT